jgi:predicted DNA-binding transcriptional regulator YafY
MAYYGDVSLISAWCELRQDFRSFRVDRIHSSSTSISRRNKAA